MILVVDDEVHSRETLRDFLEDEGYEVMVARDGNDALAKLHANRPSLLILDLIMPGMNGNTLYEEMQKSPQLAKIPVVVTTSDPSRAPLGVPTLGKPLKLAHLLSLVTLTYGPA